MLIVTEVRLTTEQEKKIKELKRKWAEEVDNLPPINLPLDTLSNTSNRPRNELAKKYMELIEKVIYGEND